MKDWGNAKTLGNGYSSSDISIYDILQFGRTMKEVKDGCKALIGTCFKERGMEYVFLGLDDEDDLIFKVVGRELSMPVEAVYRNNKKICCSYRLLELAVKLFCNNFLGEE